MDFLPVDFIALLVTYNLFLDATASVDAIDIILLEERALVVLFFR